MRITDQTMTSETTTHTAHAVEPGVWVVSWLPDRTLDHNQAVTAMTIAETVAATRRDEFNDLLVANLAAELDLTDQDAIRRAG